MPKPEVLILGHSFVRRFAAFIAQGVDKRVKNNLDLAESAQLAFQGVGGRTVDKINVFDLQRVRKVQPDIVILEIGSNDLCPRDAKPEIVGSKNRDPGAAFTCSLQCQIYCGLSNNCPFCLSTRQPFIQ